MSGSAAGSALTALDGLVAAAAPSLARLGAMALLPRAPPKLNWRRRCRVAASALAMALAAAGINARIAAAAWEGCKRSISCMGFCRLFAGAAHSQPFHEGLSGVSRLIWPACGCGAQRPTAAACSQPTPRPACASALPTVRVKIVTA